VTVVERTVAAKSPYRSREELIEILDRVMRAVDTDEDAGPRIRAARAAQRIIITDLDVVLNITACPDDAHCLLWAFSDDVDWTPTLEMSLSSEVANSYFQGRENLAIALLRGRIQTSGEARVALRYFSAATSIITHYREVIERSYSHLVLA
jgi:hypothetical protein